MTDLTPWAWAVSQQPGAAFREPKTGLVVLLVLSPPPTAPLCTSPSHVWVEDQETDRGWWEEAAEVQGWARV